MAFTEQLTEALALADIINTSAIVNTNINSAGMDMSRFKRAMYSYVLSAGTGTVDGRLQASAQANFNVVTNITGSNIAATNTLNVINTLEVRADQLPAGTRFVRLQLTGSVATVTIGVQGWGDESGYKPASQFNLNASFVGQRLVVP